jgi:Ser/Thr protein kinase RdoA (MazF antagonist)
LRCDDAVVLRDAWNVLVHLRPSPVVARVSSGAPGVSSGDVALELRVAGHAAAAGAPVVPPTTLADPGPHEHAGHAVALWTYVDSHGELDAAAAGRGLRAIHEALTTFAGDLPHPGRPTEVRAMLAPLAPTADTELLLELSSRELPAGQALHGDAHLFNCLQAASGPLWHDFETACHGPREYDLAALVHRHRSHGDLPASTAALEAYGAYDADLLEAALPVYAAWIAASWLVAAPRRAGAAEAVEEQLRFLRRYRS